MPLYPRSVQFDHWHKVMIYDGGGGVGDAWSRDLGYPLFYIQHMYVTYRLTLVRPGK